MNENNLIGYYIKDNIYLNGIYPAGLCIKYPYWHHDITHVVYMEEDIIVTYDDHLMYVYDAYKTLDKFIDKMLEIGRTTEGSRFRQDACFRVQFHTLTDFVVGSRNRHCINIPRGQFEELFNKIKKLIKRK